MKITIKKYVYMSNFQHPCSRVSKCHGCATAQNFYVLTVNFKICLVIFHFLPCYAHLYCIFSGAYCSNMKCCPQKKINIKKVYQVLTVQARHWCFQEFLVRVSVKGLFIYDVSQKWRGPDPPSPLCQQI